eukprot:EG_transcript_17515
MFTSIRKIFNKDQEFEDSQSHSADFSFSLDEQVVAGGIDAQLSPMKNQMSNLYQTTSPLDIPRHSMSNTRENSKHLVDSDDDDENIPSCLVSMSCPLPGRQPMYVPRRPLVKPAAAPKARLPNLELPPSLPSDFVFQQPPQPDPIDMRNLPDSALQYAASCPPAFRLIVDPQGLPTPLPAYVQLEATQLSHSPLIYEVLLSGCLHNPVQQTRNNAKGRDDDVARHNDMCDHDPDHDHDEMNMKDDDELAEMEL